MSPTSMAELLTALQREPGRPRVTWYGPDGERVELSGAVLANWVAKTANLLVEELDAGPGTRVQLDLPPHWRTLVWAIATWRVGACVVLADDMAPGVDVLVTDRAGVRPTLAIPVVAVALPALARRVDGALPPGAIDAASAVMTYGDTLGWVPAPDPGADALDAPGAEISHARLLAWASASTGVPDGARTLVVVAGPPTTDAAVPAGAAGAAGAVDRAGTAAGLLRAAVDVLRTSGSVVVVDAASGIVEDAARLQRVADSERVTSRAADVVAG